MAGKRIAVLSLLALVALALAVFASSSAEAGTYKVRTRYYLSTSVASAPASNTIYVTIPAPDYNYEDSSMFTFGPIDGWVAMGTSIPIGAGAGVLDSMSVLGTFNGACTSKVAPHFPLYNATIDTSKVIGPGLMAWTNTAKPISYRYQCSDNLDNDADTKINDGCPVSGPAETTCGEATCADSDGFPPWDNCDDDGDNLINDGCVAVGTAEVSSDINLQDYIEYYPYFLNNMLDPDGSGPLPPLKPRARYAGDGLVSSSNMLIEVVVLEPGQITQLPGIKAQMVSGLGYVMITALNNPWDQTEAPGAVSDFCSPMASMTQIYGTTTDNPATAANEAGYISQKNPAANAGVLGTGTLMSRNYSMGERDADGDGWENDLDPCYYTLDPLWDPRVTCVHPGAGDHDCDGLPDSCDPDPQGASPEPDPIPAYNCPGPQNDCDNDAYNNRQDISPLVANGLALDNQADTDSTVQGLNADLGPGPDSIGDASDDSDNDGKEDGSTVAPGVAGTGNCTDGIDNDLDGKTDMIDPQCLVWTDKSEITAGRTLAQIWGTTPGTGIFWQSLPWAAVCVGATDTDGDGYCDTLETMLGSPTNNGPETGDQCIDAEDPSCVNGLNDDATDDGATPRINDGCPAKGAEETICDETSCAAPPYCDDDGDTRPNDGCPAVNTAENDDCADADDDDGDTLVNDGCPAKAVDDDTTDAGETAAGRRINDGCPAVGAAETGCNDNIDNDADTTMNDGCPQAGDRSETGAECTDPESACGDAIDSDGDTNINDGCPVIGTDDDSDGHVNDGCIMVGYYAEVGAQCDNNTNDDAPVPDQAEPAGYFVNDGCPVIGVPESLVIDATMNSPAALPSASPPASCSDGVDNDNDGTVDTDSETLGCDPAHASYTGDTDKDGVPDATDNCPSVYNPEQTNTDKALHDAGAQLPVPTALPADALGDACDPDSDNDGWSDSMEWYIGTDPRANSSHSPDPAYPPDVNEDKFVTVVGDVAAYSGNIGMQISANPPNNYDLSRLDLNQDDFVTVVGDVALFSGKIGWQTSPGSL